MADETSAQMQAGPRFDQVLALQYVTTEKAAEHRAIVDVFANAKARYRVQLRPAEVLQLLVEGNYQPRLSEDTVHARLEALREWGNLDASHDAAAVEKLDDFYRKRLIYRLTPVGEAAHAAVRSVEQAVGNTGALQTTMLAKILEGLQTLEKMCRQSEPDPDTVKSVLDAVHAAFESLTTEASRFIGELQRFLSLDELDTESFMVRKHALVAYLQGFVDRLVKTSDPIGRLIRRLDGAAHQSLVDTASRSSDLPPAMGDLAPDEVFRREQAARWAGVVQWFAPPSGRSVERELLRVADQSVSQLVHSLHRLRERMSSKVDRTADFRQLARWFSECPSDAAAHVLFTRAFGLHGARHFHIAEDDADLVTPRTSWWDAHPVEVPVHLRKRGTSPKGGRTGKLVDFSAGRDWLRMRRAQERQRRDDAVASFRRPGRALLLSELDRLEKGHFEVLLELLDAALAGDRDRDGVRSGETEDGRFKVSIRAIPGSEPVAIETTEGRFTTPSDAELFVEVSGEP